MNFFVLKRLGAQYDEKRELGWKNHLDSEKIICAKSEIENEIEKVKAKTYKFSNYVLMIVFCVCFIFSLSFKGFTQITIVIGIMWLVIYCYYIIGVSKV